MRTGLSLIGMDIDLAAMRLAELGSPVRLAAFRLLVRAGRQGLTAGQLQAHLDIPKSTLSHHMQHLIMAGLVSRVREGRNRRCRANFDAMRDLLGFLEEDCCRDAVSNKHEAA